MDRVVLRRGETLRDSRRDAVIVIRPYIPDDEAACRACVVELQDAERGFDQRLRPGEAMADEYLAQMHVHCRDHAGAIFVALRIIVLSHNTPARTLYFREGFAPYKETLTKSLDLSVP